MPFHQCAAATANGHQCRNSIWGAPALCGIHRRVLNVRLFTTDPQQPVVEPVICRMCGRLAVNAGYCTRHDALRPRLDLPREEQCRHRGCQRAAQGEHHRCRPHTLLFVRRQQRLVFDEMYVQGLVAAAEAPDAWIGVVDIWRAQVNQPFVNENLIHHLEINLARELRIPALWNHHMGGHAVMDENGAIGWRVFDVMDDIPLPPHVQRRPARGDLEAFVRDGQNVHTHVVTQQTNSSLDILLNADIPSDQKTVTETHMKFMEHIALDKIKTSLDVVRDVDRDVKRWYRTGTCRQEGDYLYKRTLDGLWAKIKTSPAKQELEIRLWQEMVDSLGMCCDGHITRLANVLCGFDDAFAPEMSPGEKLQNRMAVIAAMEGGSIHQTAEALAAFKEFNVPRDQWEAWIDAL